MYINISYFLNWDCTGEIVKNSKELQNKDGFPSWGTKRQQSPAHFMSFGGIFIGFLTCLRSGKGRERNTFTLERCSNTCGIWDVWKKLNWDPHGGCHSLRWLSPLLSNECFVPERDVKKEVQTHTYIHTYMCCFRFLLLVRAKCVRHPCGLSNHPK